MMLRLVLSNVSIVMVAALVACGSDAPAGSTAATEAATSPTAATGLSSPASASSAVQVADTDTSPAVSGLKLSANNASRSELAAGFEAAGISNASKWAREVEEYRPYADDDTDYTKLRGELAKYNPAPGVIDSIIELLELP